MSAPGAAEGEESLSPRWVVHPAFQPAGCVRMMEVGCQMVAVAALSHTSNPRGLGNGRGGDRERGRGRGKIFNQGGGVTRTQLVARSTAAYLTYISVSNFSHTFPQSSTAHTQNYGFHMFPAMGGWGQFVMSKYETRNFLLITDYPGWTNGNARPL